MALDLEKLKALEAAATSGPWRVVRHYCPFAWVLEAPDGYSVEVGGCPACGHFPEPDQRAGGKADAALVAAARNALPELITEVERLRKALARIAEGEHPDEAPEDARRALAGEAAP